MRHGETLEGENTVQIVHRIAAVLRAFGNKGLLGITDLANATGLPKSTTHRLVTALVNEGLLVQDEDNHKYAQYPQFPHRAKIRQAHSDGTARPDP